MENTQMTETKSPSARLRELMAKNMTMNEARIYMLSEQGDGNEDSKEDSKEDSNDGIRDIIHDLGEFPDDKFCPGFFEKLLELDTIVSSSEPVNTSNLMNIISDLLKPSFTMKIDEARGKYAEIIFGLFSFGQKTQYSCSYLINSWTRLLEMTHRQCKGPRGKGTSNDFKSVVRDFNRSLSKVKQMINHDDIMFDACKVIARGIMMISSISLDDIVVPPIDERNRPIGPCIVWTNRLPSFYRRAPGLSDVPGAGRENFDGSVIEKAMKHRPCILACSDTCDLGNRQSLKNGVDNEFQNRREALFSCLSAVQLTRPCDVVHTYNLNGMLTRQQGIHQDSLDLTLFFRRQHEFATIKASHNRIKQLLITNITNVSAIRMLIQTLNLGNENLYILQELRYYYPFYMAVKSRIEHLSKLTSYTLDQRAVACCNSSCGFTIIYDKSTTYANRVTCPNCKSTSCCQCGTSYHGNSPCTEVDDEMRSIMNSSSVRACPSCGNMADRGTGCRHITCESHYCWDCNLVLANGNAAVLQHMEDVHGGDYGII